MHPYHHPLFVKFIVYFNQNQDYFECHEVLEDYWKSIPDSDKEHPLTAFILLATGLYHWRRGNSTGAYRTLRKAVKNFLTFISKNPTYTEEIDFKRLIHDVQNSINRLEKQLPFESISLIVTSSQLTALVESAEQSMELLSFESDALIHKHMLRDRSDILREREEKKKDRC
ncbi:DUF309 domain-containing protein [Sporosarcina limicola]|uniref:Metal-dependent hydrolase n=1 Tax=Sporosarcina limicola TaxID=34101 RepID=A0A927MGB9_9BACL|nr:DUF309 domain-containing protein [Sporosarcina limicola]MBE1554075.1 putative metal-dependent hydrolase [Sporosarcina limicola]